MHVYALIYLGILFTSTEPEPEPVTRCDWPHGVCAYIYDSCPPDIPYDCRNKYYCPLKTNKCCCRYVLAKNVLSRSLLMIWFGICSGFLWPMSEPCELGSLTNFQLELWATPVKTTGLLLTVFDTMISKLAPSFKHVFLGISFGTKRDPYFS